MRIEIVDIDRSERILVGESFLGYKVTFSCPLVSGAAVLVPYTGFEDKLTPGASLSVETSHEKVTNLNIINDSFNDSISKTAKEGNYQIVGTVGLNIEDEVFYIDVVDFTFILDVEETEGVKPKKSDRVQFLIHGLTLWDENI